AGRVPEGQVGAGTGARVDRGGAAGGLGATGGPVAGTAWSVGAVVAANAAGRPTAPGDGSPVDGVVPAPHRTGPQQRNTSLVVVVTDAPLDVAACARLAAAAHAGLARAVDPSHTLVDGDVVLALATAGAGGDPGDVAARVALEAGAAAAVTRAFARAVRPALRAGGGAATA
uniref:P1 family peptidase n=1 Tax=Aquipuribacter sp. SD81 TaxID=3127703 RepID=UPI00301829E6